MKAAIYKQYGPPEVVTVTDFPLCVPKENQIMIKVHYSTVNRTDCGFRSAEYVISRLFSGLLRPKQPILGCEFSGEVLSCGSAVKLFKPGDRVFGFDDKGFGGHAEFLCIDETAAVDIIPESYEFREAATLLEGSHYALCNLRAAKVSAGSDILVYGATGAIGSAAVQLATAMGARVTAVCKGEHLELVKSLGAGRVIDYQTEDFTQCGEHFDLAFDAVGKSSFGACKPLLKENGLYISTELGKNGQNIWLALLGLVKSGKKVLFPLPTISKEDVAYIKNLAIKGQFKPVIDREYPLEQIVQAHQYAESGQKVGNVLVKVTD